MTRRDAFAGGLRAVAPLLVGVVPFGLVFGVTAASSSIGGGLGYLTSIVIFAGAAQLATIQLFDAGAAAGVIIATALVINARHLMYSAALADHFVAFPTPWRLGLPYLLTDQAFAVSIGPLGEMDDPVVKRYHFFGAATGLWVSWQLTTAAGVLLGAQVPRSWSLDFAIPLVFLALLVMGVKDRPGLVAAVVAATAAVLVRGVPYQLGLMIAALSGVVAGVLTARETS